MKGFSLCLALNRAAVKVFCARDSDSVLSGLAQSTRAAELRQRRVETLAAPDTETNMRGNTQQAALGKRQRHVERTGQLDSTEAEADIQRQTYIYTQAH